MTPSDSATWRGICAGVAVTTMATLLQELALTRIFSVALFYHFAFMAISLAMFGLGAGAIFSYRFASRPSASPPWERLGLLSTLNIAVTAGALLVVLSQPVTIRVQAENLMRLALIYFV